MEDIKKAIEEEAWAYLNPDDEDVLDFSDQDKLKAFEYGANFAISKWQEATRWRKVEEETPEIISEEPYFINVKTDDNNIETLYIEEGTNCIDKLCRHYVEWQPINP